MKYENLTLGSLIVAVVVGAYFWESRTQDSMESPETSLEERVVALEARDAATVRQAVWDALHPCQGRINPFFPDRWPEHVPDDEWCAKNIGAPVPPFDSADSLSMEMFGCVYNYESGLQEIDSVEDPNVHDSWVLSGDCERLAHQVQAHPDLSLCANFVDHVPATAVECRTDMQRHLEIWCLRKDAEDGEIRECLRNHLVTKLDPDADELREYLTAVK